MKPNFPGIYVGIKHSMVVLILLLSFSVVHAQDMSSMTGHVTDSSGALLPGATVVLENRSTGIKFTQTTDSQGTYTFGNIPPGGGYIATFSHDGFTSFQVKDISASVGVTRTQDAKLSPGAHEQIEVSAEGQGITLNTTDASIGSTIDVERLNDLPVQSRDSPAALFTLSAGYGNGSITGARTDQSSTTVDGIDVNDIAAGGGVGTIIGNAPVDSVEQFSATVAGVPTDMGTGSGGQYQLVTRNGTNTFHGNVNEYHRDTSTTANTWFNNNIGLPRTPLIRNQFGGNIGGPIRKDKLFFFFNFLDYRTIQSSSVSQTVPLDSFRNGNIGYINDNAGCGQNSRNNTTPNCISYLTSAQVAALDPQGIGFNQNILQLISSRYPHVNDVTLGDGINTGGLRFNVPTPFIETNYVGRIDYNMTPTQKIFGRFTIQRANDGNTVQFPGDPTAYYDIDRSYGYVVSHVWQLGSNKINQFYYGDNISKLSFPPQYKSSAIDVYSFPFAGPYGGYGSQKRRVPIPEIRDDFSWQRGTHGITFGGQFKFIKTNSQLINNFNYYSVGIGGNTPNLDASLRPADINSANTASQLYDSLFSTALGRIASASSNFNYSPTGVLPQGSGETRHYRFYETELYIGDNWKITPKLTLDYGVRYMLYSVPYETTGAESVQNFTFDKYFAQRLAQNAAGASGDDSLPFITYSLGGKANKNAPDLYAPSYKDFAPRVALVYAPTRQTVVNASAGIIFDRTVINAVNFIQDQSSQLFQSSNSQNYGQTNARKALLTDPRLGANLSVPAPPPAPVISIPFTPDVSDGTPNGLGNNIFNYVVDPTLKDPYSIAFTAGLEQQIPGHMIMKLNYAGRLGRRLLAQADASQVLDFPDKASGQSLSSAVSNLELQARAGANYQTVTPVPWFENVVLPGIGQQLGYNSNTALLIDYEAATLQRGDLADFMQFIAANGLMNSNVAMASQFAGNTYITNKGFSTYNGLLLSLSKNYSNGLEFDFYYTWSHSMDNVSAPANFIAASSGYGFICDATRPRECRANSDFDVNQRITGDFVYDLPIGRGRQFLSGSHMWLDEIVGGWKISGIPTFDTGFAMNTSTDAYIAGYANNASAIFNGRRGDVMSHIHQTNGTLYFFADPNKALADFSFPTGFQIGSRNNLRGPSTFELDMGLAKTFVLIPDNKLWLKFRADFFNILNHPVFNNPSVDIDSSSFGQISSTSVAPRVGQFSLRLEF